GVIAGTTTDALAEGETNLYYTDERVGAYISGSSTVPHVGGGAYGEMLYWTGSAWAARATSTLAINSDSIIEGATNLFFTTPRVQSYLNTIDKGFFFSTTSADYWKTANNFFSTTSADYWRSATNFFSTTSADYLASQRNYFSTSSADFFVTQRDFFSTTSADY